MYPLICAQQLWFEVQQRIRLHMNQQRPSKPAHQNSLLRMFTVCTHTIIPFTQGFGEQWRFWQDYTNVHAGLGLCCYQHMSRHAFCPCNTSFCLLATSQAYQPVWTESIGCFTSHGLASTGLTHSDWLVGKLLAFHWLSCHCLHFIGRMVHRKVTTKEITLTVDRLQGDIIGLREDCFIPAC